MQIKLVLWASSLLALGGCATLSDDAGFNTVRQAAQTHLKQDVRWARSDAEREAIRSEVKALLASELSAEQATRIALLNHPGLQATYAELGIAEANLVEAGRLRNPGFTFSRLTQGGESPVDIERKFLFDLLGLLTMPARTEIEARRFEQTQLRVSGEVMRIAIETRRAYYEAVAADQSVRYMAGVKEAADASAELVRRMAAAGNLSKRDQAREQLFLGEAAMQGVRARQQALVARERLMRLMGLNGGEGALQLPSRLPELPKTANELPAIETAMIEQRGDIQAARREVDGLAKSLGLTKTTRFINVLDTGYRRDTSTGQPAKTGYEIELSIPIFDFGEAKVARAEAVYRQAVNRLGELAINARSELREAHAAYQAAFTVAKHYRDEIVPLRKQLSDETLLRYNGMLISVFELIADARGQMASVNAAIEAQRDFWLADVNVQAATLGAGVRGGTMDVKAPAAGGDASGGH